MGRRAELTYTTDLQLKRLKTPGLYNVAPGLFLRVTTPEAKSWVFRFMLNGKAHAMGLGSFPAEMSLEGARDLTTDYRRLRKQGTNPIEHRKLADAEKRALAAKAKTFRQCAETYIDAHKDGWKNAKHAAQWTATLETWAMPELGALPVQDIDVARVTAVLKPIWKTKTETASRVRGRIERVLDWATVQGYRQGDNPALWRGRLEHSFPAKTALRAVQHHPALPYGELPAFMSALTDDGIATQALRFTILTAARTSEVIGMSWQEVDLENAVWTVPPSRMKGKKNKSREHRVPLSKAALAILRKRHELTGGQGYVFPGKPKRPLSNMAMLAVLDRMGRNDITVHGFRSTFRDWAAEQTSFPRGVAEAALAHVVGDKVEAAYRRGDLFEKRCKMMNAWATFCATPTVSGKVINIGKRA